MVSDQMELAGMVPMDLMLLGRAVELAQCAVGKGAFAAPPSKIAMPGCLLLAK